jgi:trimeric autotransporter adhesin
LSTNLFNSSAQISPIPKLDNPLGKSRPSVQQPSRAKRIGQTPPLNVKIPTPQTLETAGKDGVNKAQQQALVTTKQDMINKSVSTTVRSALSPAGNILMTQKSPTPASQGSAPLSSVQPTKSLVQPVTRKPVVFIFPQDSRCGTPSVVIPSSTNKPNPTVSISSERAPMTPGAKPTISPSQSSVAKSSQSKGKDAPGLIANKPPALGNGTTPKTTPGQPRQKSVSVEKNPTSTASNQPPTNSAPTPTSKTPDIQQKSSPTNIASAARSQSGQANVNDKPSTMETPVKTSSKGTPVQSITDTTSSSQVAGSPLASQSAAISSSRSQATNPNPTPTRQLAPIPPVETLATASTIPKTNKIIIKFSPKKAITTESRTGNNTSTQNGSTQGASTQSTSSQGARTQGTTPTIPTFNTADEVAQNSQLIPNTNPSCEISHIVGPPLSGLSSPSSQSEEEDAVRVCNSSVSADSLSTTPNYAILI